MQNKSSLWTGAIRNGLLGGAVSLLLALVGMVVTFGEKDIISGIITMGQILLITPIIIFSYRTVQRAETKSIPTLILLGMLSGLAGGFVLAALVWLGQLFNLRDMFSNASPELYEMLTFGQAAGSGTLLLLGVAMLMGILAVIVFLTPARIRSALTQAVLVVTLIGLLRELIMTVMQHWGEAAKLFEWIFAPVGLTIIGAVVVFLLTGGLVYWRSSRSTQKSVSKITEKVRLRNNIAIFAGTALLLVLLPPILGVFFSDILDTVGIFIMMGLGLNIVVGFAGLLDLGYVAFFAIGAYTMGVLTSPELIAEPLTYWQALPFALGASVFAGILLGLPVLKMRGDYLAIVTLGFGEIIRLLALSDWLAPWLGGTQGIQKIARPHIGTMELATQGQLYYLILAFIGIAGFIAWRLKDSHLGRSWMALREDEDVARAMGINHVTTKLMAFATGAFFAGLSGTVFAAKLSSAYPHSFNFLVSINVLALIIIGGMGSIPGVFIGALVLMGLPEILREFAEYRYLVYGAVLVAMMLSRPEGLVPEARRKLELHESQTEEADKAPQPVLKNPGQ